MITLARKKRTAQYRQFHAAGECSPKPSPAPPWHADNFLPPPLCRNRDASHWLRRVPGPARREGLLLRRDLQIEDCADARRRRGPECRRIFHALARRHGDGERSPKQPRSPRAPPLSSHRRLSRSQLLNTSSNSIFAGDLVEWTLSYTIAQRGDSKRQRQGPRRIGAHASFRLPSRAVDARRSPFTPLRFQASRPPPFPARR